VLEITKLTTTALAASSLLVATPLEVSASLLIDDFESGAFSVSDPAPGNPVDGIAEQSSIPVLGGVRQVRVGTGPGVTGGASLTLTAGPDSVNVALVPSPPGGQVRFHYDGIANGAEDLSTGTLNANLSAFGDRFSIEVTSVTAPLFVSLQVAVYDSNSSFSAPVAPAAFTPGSYEILFSSYSGIDFTDVNAIQLVGATADGWSIGSFSVVPEPSTALLLAIGLIVVSRARSRH
jgi:hypothetical protein